MKIDLVKKLSTEERLLYWISERNKIRVRKESHYPFPWTDDEILATYKFCNVIRMQDKVSKWLLKNWYLPNRGHPHMYLAVVMARCFNSIETLTSLGFPKEWDPIICYEKLRRRALGRKPIYGSAYIISGSIDPGKPKYHQTVWLVCDHFYQRGKNIIDTESMENTWKGLLAFRGLAEFMAGQIVADMRYAIDGEWWDRYSWAPCGPGSIRGLNRLIEREVDLPMKQSTFIKHFLPLYEKLKPIINSYEIDGMEAMDFQNCLCEFDKYERALWGEGKPKQYYRFDQKK